MTAPLPAAQEIDLLSMHLYPDFAVACSFQCKMDWASNTVRTKPYSTTLTIHNPNILNWYNRDTPKVYL